MIEAKAFRTLIRIYTLFKIERLSPNIKLTLHKAMIRTVMTYACPAWELAADTYLVRLQRLHNKILCIIVNLPRCTPVCDVHTAFSLCMYTIIQTRNHENEHVRSIGQSEARHRKYKSLKLGGGQAYDCSSA
jgi:hypothetical protein